MYHSESEGFIYSGIIYKNILYDYESFIVVLMGSRLR